MKPLADDWLLQRPGARDFSGCYLRHFEELTDGLEAALSERPALAAVAAVTAVERRQRYRLEARRLFERACEGRWGEYAGELRRVGVRAEGLGVTLPDWFALARVWSRLLIPHLVGELSAEPARLTDALVAMNTFVDAALEAVGESYLSTSRARLQRSEEDLRATLASIGEALLATDAEGRIVQGNAVAASLVGMSQAEMLGRPLDEVWRVAPDPQAPGVEGAFELTTASGAVRPVQASRAPIGRDRGRPAGEVLVFRDVTPTRRRERELRRWETLFQRAPWGICLASAADRTIEFVNDAFASLYGVEAAAMRGRTIGSLYAPEELARARLRYQDRARQAGGASFETVHIRADGSRFPALVDAALVPGVDGHQAWAVSVRDLTERKQLESLTLRGVELELEKRRAQEASRLKSEFLANMSHELRTPLNAILGFSQLLRDGDVGELSERQQEFVDDIHTSGEHLLRLINGILDLSKVEAGKMEFYPETVELSGLIGEVTDVLRVVAHAREVTIQADVAPDLGSVFLDPSRLKQVLYNYLSNAIKFSPRQGRVWVRARLDGPLSFRLEVADQGIGISADDQRRLFTEFEQLDRGRTKAYGGTGLGLALTRRLVEAQGGTVGVQSEPGAGSVFYAVLPCQSPMRGSLPQPRRLDGPTPESPRVLVIEDDPADQDRIVSALLRAGYAVDTAATGAQALRSAEEQRYDAITLDLLLPDTNGLTVLGALRERPGSSDVPVVVISLLTEQVMSGLLVHGVLRKPLQPESLLASLTQAGVSRRAPGPILVVDDDEPSARLMATNLEQIGFRTLVAHDGQHALERARTERPVAVVLDLVMPQLDGFGFLQHFRAEPDWKGVPVLIWTAKDLSAEEYRSLLADAAAVLPKGGEGLNTLTELLRNHLPSAPAVGP